MVSKKRTTDSGRKDSLGRTIWLGGNESRKAHGGVIGGTLEDIHGDVAYDELDAFLDDDDDNFYDLSEDLAGYDDLGNLVEDDEDTTTTTPENLTVTESLSYMSDDITTNLPTGSYDNAYGSFAIEYDYDEDDLPYARLGITLPEDERIYVETEDGTYGEMTGVRIPLDEDTDLPNSSGAGADMDEDNQLHGLCFSAKDAFDNGDNSFEFEGTSYEIEYLEDEDNRSYGYVKYEFPDSMLVEIEGDTTGYGGGFRMYNN